MKGSSFEQWCNDHHDNGSKLCKILEKDYGYQNGSQLKSTSIAELYQLSNELLSKHNIDIFIYCIKK